MYRPVFNPIFCFCLLWAGLFTLPVAGTADSETLHRFTYTQAQMGVPFQITLYAESETVALDAVKAAYSHVEALNQSLSHYEYESEISRLSRSAGSGKSFPVSPELWTVLSTAQDLSLQTQGAFDVSIGLCARLWSKARRDKAFPTEHHLNMVLQTVGYQDIHLDPSSKTVTLNKPRMLLDLSGIAKGFALDEAGKVLEKQGICTYLVQAGGDIRACGSPPDKPGWIVGLTSPESQKDPVTTIQIKDRALASSGDLYQFVDINGQRYSHILDPKTGIGLTTRVLVHVIAHDAMTADSLATALNVLGPEKGLALIKGKSGIEARISVLTDEGVEIYDTSGLAKYMVNPDLK